MGTTPGGPGRDRFPGYDVLAQAPAWDPVTQGVVLRRLGPPPPQHFFTVEEEAVCRSLLDRLLAQDAEPRVPVFELIDARLAQGETDGWHYDDMPTDDQAWRLSLAALDDDARQDSGGHRFADLGRGAQRDVLEAVRTGSEWHSLPAARVWGLWLRYALAAFYSHPWSWNEIGFGGPAYPRGYENIGLDRREHWEVAEIDAFDPEPWSHRVERARRRHLDRSAEER